jgi:hypothetical protein
MDYQAAAFFAVTLVVVIAAVAMLIVAPWTLLLIVKWLAIAACVPLVLFLLFAIWASMVPWR